MFPPFIVESKLFTFRRAREALYKSIERSLTNKAEPRRADDVNRECGTESVIGVGSSEWLGGTKTIF
jgi:hypothetical protein